METEKSSFHISMEEINDDELYDRIIEALKDEIHKKLLEEWVDLETRVKKLNKSCA